VGADTAVAIFGRTILGLVLVAAGVSKLAQGRASFARVIRDYRLLPDALVGATAATLPWVEVATGGLLYAGAARMPASALATLLFAAFAAAIAANLLRGRIDIACGCFGASEHRLSWTLAARNALLTALAIAVGRAGLPPLTDDPDALPVALSATAVAAVALVLVTTRRVRQLDFGVPHRADAEASAHLTHQHDSRHLPLVRSEEGSPS
jgi:hypothetical protein